MMDINKDIELTFKSVESKITYNPAESMLTNCWRLMCFFRHERAKQKAKIREMTAEIERLRVERDAAVEDCTVSDICSVCKHNSKNENDCRDRKHFVKVVGQADCFEWRGVKGDHTPS